jgi:hypothetical protein
MLRRPDRSHSRRGFIGALGAGAGLPVLGLGEARAAAAPEPRGGIHDITLFGAIPGGKKPGTAAIQKAIDACAATGGGSVLVPPGRFLTGALFLRSHVHLELSAGAVLVASERPEDFPPTTGRHEGIERTVFASLINGADLENVAVSGRGVLDGQGSPWWKADEVTRKLRVASKMPREADNPREAPLRWPRPRMIALVRCRDVFLQGVTFVDGPSYNLHLVYCEDVVVDGIAMSQQRMAQGTDGIIVDSSRRVRISNCSISSGGDCVGIKSGHNEEGRRIGLPSADVVVTNCHFYRSGGSGVGIGSETAGGIANVVISNCVVSECLRGMHIRSPRGRGGVVESLHVSNLVIDRIEEMAIKISHFFDSVRMEGHYIPAANASRQNLELARSRTAPVDEGTPTFRDFVFCGLTVGRVQDVALIEGLPERFIRGVRFESLTVLQATGGISCTMVADLGISDCSINGVETPAVDAREVERLEIHRLRCAHPQTKAPLIWLESVSRAFIHGCNVADPGGAYEWMRQAQCKEITLGANNVPTRTAAR